MHRRNTKPDDDAGGGKPGFKERLSRWKRGIGEFARRQPEPQPSDSRGDELVNRLGGDSD